MDKVFDKLSAYNIFTNLFPGVIYCFVSTKSFGLSLIPDDVVVAVFLYYFCGMVISRVSSIVIEPLMIKSGFIKYSAPIDYIQASKADKLIEQLLETSNSYRSVVALAFCLFVTGAWAEVVVSYPTFAVYSHYILLIAIIILFSLAFRKQTRHITKRVALHKENNGSEP